ncbi:MAG: hypothetical protein IJ037_07575 [Clostridia bacterium]|nr:hypothetical protein [Clostridia bacterium]MBQ8370398.1 hypothetical protein [Clostridia bacterium]
MKRLSLVLAVVMTLLCVFTACGEEKSGGLSINPDGAAATTQIVSGLTGESYTMPLSSSKIVSLSPAATMILEELGAASKLIGVDSVSAEYVTSSAQTITAADAVGLAPEAIFVDEADKDAIGTTDIPVFVIPTAKSIADINSLVRICGKVAGITPDTLVTKVTNALSVAQLGSAVYTTKIRAYVDLGDGETVGAGTYVTEMLYAAGFENICTIDGFGSMSEEDVIAANPEFIFTTGSVDDYLNNPAFAEVTAVVDGQVHSINEKEIRFGSSYVTNCVSVMYAAADATRADE